MTSATRVRLSLSHPEWPWRRAVVVCLAAGALLLASPVHAADVETTVVYARVYHGYTRAKLPDNSFKPETYGFAEGGRLNDAGPNETIDGLPFAKIAETLAVALRNQNYLPAASPATAELAILVFWGTTQGSLDAGPSGASQFLTGANQGAVADSAAAGPGYTSDSDSQMPLLALANGTRDQTNARNALLLGYGPALERARASLMPNLWDYVITELEHNRYFVVLKAYDFQALHMQKQQKLLWEVRFSIREKGNDFSRQLASMVQQAARYFGQDSGGSLQRPAPLTNVRLGELKVIETDPKK